MDTRLRILVFLGFLAALSIALYLVSGSTGGRIGETSAYGACFKCSGELVCRVEVINDGESMLTVSRMRLEAGNSSMVLTPLYNYTSIPGHTHVLLVIHVDGKPYLVLRAPRYMVLTTVSASGMLVLGDYKPRSVFNETWVSPEGSLEGFYPMMLSHKRLVTGPGSAAYIVLRASAVSSNISRLHVKLYAFHDELVYEAVSVNETRSYEALLPLYYVGHEAVSGATSLLVSYSLSGGSGSMLVLETQAWRTIPIHLYLDVITGGSIETYLPLIPGMLNPGMCEAQHS